MHFSDKKEFQVWAEECPIDLIEFPVPQQSFLFSKFRVKPGGSYLKLFPSIVVRHSMIKSINKGLTPIIYLHPYDIYYGYDLRVKWNELKGIKLRNYWYMRQMQWMGLFNWSQKNKLQKVFSEFNNIGCLGDRLAKKHP